MSDTEVTRDEAAQRYELRVGGQLAGFAEYQTTPELIVFTHTVIEPQFEGQGLGSTLARAALDDVRAAGGRQVLPLCPFITSWIGRHAEYADLVYRAPEPTAED
ncbi:MAG TPA: GNAT family N-acetyltransferase [Spirillospora sp.]|nr:GNAT family N-acetyltransferase [Spirillospora sp.]